MKVKKRVFIIEGLAFLFIGLVFLLNSFSSLTGAVVFENVNSDLSGLLGLIFVIAGLLIMVEAREKEGGLVRRVEKAKIKIKAILDSGSIGSYNQLRKLAGKIGYRLDDNGPKHTDVYDGKTKITEIPRHTSGVATGTFRDIAKKLYDNAP